MEYIAAELKIVVFDADDVLATSTETTEEFPLETTYGFGEDDSIGGEFG